MKQNTESDSEKLYQLFSESFDYVDGVLYWKTRPLSHFKTQSSMRAFNSQFAGKRAGRLDNNRYERVKISGKERLTHRVVFFIFNGYFPEFIDHVDGNRLNNRIKNLRPATYNENGYNQKLSVNNTSGVKGVRFLKGSNRFQASIKVNGKCKYLGMFKTIEEAKAVRVAAANKYHGEFANHG